MQTSLDDKPYMNILTRTSGRPKFFWYNRRSVQSQTYPKIRHFVCYDDKATYNSYLKHYEQEENLSILEIARSTEFKSDRFPPNLYCNKLTEMVPDGWIMYLDDDDILLREDTVERIMSADLKDNGLLLWKVKFPNDRIIPRRFGKKPILGDISAIGFAFNKSQWHLSKAGVDLWDDRKGSDYRVVAKLYSRLEPIWIDDVLTGVNYARPRLIGTGQRMDFENGDMTTKNLEEYEAWAFAHLKINHDYSHIQNLAMPSVISQNSQGNPKKVTLKIVKKDSLSTNMQTSTPVMGNERLPVRVSIKPSQTFLDKKFNLKPEAEAKAKVHEEENQYEDHEDAQEREKIEEAEAQQDGDEDQQDRDEDQQDGEPEEEPEEVEKYEDDREGLDGEEEGDDEQKEQEHEELHAEDQDYQDGQELGEEQEEEPEELGEEQEELGEEQGEETVEKDEQDEREGLYQGSEQGHESEQTEDANIDNIVDDVMEQNLDSPNGQEEDEVDEAEFQLHPQITKLLDLLSEDGRLFVLKEEDLKSVFIKLLKMQTLAIEQQDEIKKQLDSLKGDNAKLRELLASSAAASLQNGSIPSGILSSKGISAMTGLRGSTATDLLKKIDRPTGTATAIPMTGFNSEHNKKSTLKDDKRRKITPAPVKPASVKPASDITTRIHNGKLSLRKTPVTSQVTRGKCASDNSCNITASKAGGGGFNQAYASTENVSRDKKNPDAVRVAAKEVSKPGRSYVGLRQADKNYEKVGSRAKTLLKTTTKGRNAEDELERLLSTYAQDSSDTNKDSEVGSEQDESDLPVLSKTVGIGASVEGKELDINTVIEFFDAIFVLNLSNKAETLYKKLEQLGFQNIEVVASKPNLTLIDSLAEIVLKAKNKGLKTIMVLKDNVLVHQNIMEELAYQLSNMDDKARVLYLGAALMRTKDTTFDPEFYLQTYSDLVEQGIDDEEKAQKHWKTRGHREGRWGSRNMNHPDLVKDLSAVVLHTDVFDILIKNLSVMKKGAGGIKAFEKLMANYCYVVTPPPFMNELTKYNKSKNQSNAFLYF